MNKNLKAVIVILVLLLAVLFTTNHLKTGSVTSSSSGNYVDTQIQCSSTSDCKMNSQISIDESAKCYVTCNSGTCKLPDTKPTGACTQ